MTGEALFPSLIGLGGVVGLVMVFGILVGRCVDRRESILDMALVLGWVAWTGGRIGEVFRVAPESGTLFKLSIEGVVVSVGVLIALNLMTNPQKGGPNGEPDEVSRFDTGYLVSTMKHSAGLMSMGAAFVVSVIVAMIFGQSDLAGQAVGVGFLAGIGGGVAGTLVSTSVKKNDPQAGPTAFAPLMIGVMLCSVFMPILASVYPGTGKLMGLVLQGDLPGFFIVSPSAWVLGALMGVPIGHSWVEQTTQQAASGSAARA